jgi:hypothetical protein
MKPALPLLPVRLRNCSGVLVDSNVLLDLATKDARWGDWSRRALAECADRTKLVINPIVYHRSAKRSLASHGVCASRFALGGRFPSRKVLPGLPEPRRLAHHAPSRLLYRSAGCN